MISIHTLTQRVTLQSRPGQWQRHISIHTLTQRVTRSPGWRRVYHVISIHTLTQRVTEKVFGTDSYGKISIHILTRRMTSGRTTVFHVHCISIHILIRRMTMRECGLFPAFYISIHTLARRVTTAIFTLPYLPNNFNPHPHMEDDAGRRTNAAAWTVFQSTPSYGGRHFHIWNNLDEFDISIHTLIWRTTAAFGISYSEIQHI